MLLTLMSGMPREIRLMDKRYSFIGFRGHNHSSGKLDVQVDQIKGRFFQPLNENLGHLGIGSGIPNEKGGSYEGKILATNCFMDYYGIAHGGNCNGGFISCGK